MAAKPAKRRGFDLMIRTITKTSLAALTTAALFAAPVAEAKTKAPPPAVERTGQPTGVISSTALIPPGFKILYLSGGTASPPDPSKPDELGDTAAQTLSILTKMKAQLEGMGWSMGDIVKMNVFLVAALPGGRMDAPGMNGVFKTFFGTADQPNKPTRSTVQVAALGRPNILVEIEGIAAKAP
jgi:2-iminobutanoate/2-iminopropanoate deaminase